VFAQEWTLLSEMEALSGELARAFQVRSLAALKDEDDAKAGTAKTHFNDLFLGIRRSVALKARLDKQCRQQGQTAEDRRDRRQDRIDQRRRKVAEGVSRAIAAATPDADERDDLATDMWERLTEGDRIDTDLADSVLPIEALILRFCRKVGVTAVWFEAAKAGPMETRVQFEPWPETSYGLGRFRPIPAADIGLPEGQVYMLNTDTGAVFNEDGRVVKTLTDHPMPPESPPPDPGPRDTGPPDATAPPPVPIPASTAPPDPAPPPGPPPRELTLAERAEVDRQRRREALERGYAENARVAEARRQRLIEADKQSS
jgi:hypothetical protein